MKKEVYFIYTTKIGQISEIKLYVNKLCDIGRMNKEEKFNKTSLAKFNKKEKDNEIYD